MPRLRNVRSGVVVNVSDEVARGLTGYEPVEKPAPKTAAAKKAAPSKSADK